MALHLARGKSCTHTASARAGLLSPKLQVSRHLRGRERRHGSPTTTTKSASVDTISQPGTDSKQTTPLSVAHAANDVPQRTEGASYSNSSNAGNFVWTNYWYPVHVLAMIDPSRPHAVQLLGKQLVLWRDGQGAWHCNEDACPHRLAPLSEGRIEADGTLQCSYHGWRFDGSGKCVEIPQALDDKAKAVACNSSRSCVTTYPVQEKYGLLWVWPAAGAAAAEKAAAAHLPVSKALDSAWQAGRFPTWYRRDLPYSWDMLVENLSDPSHLPFSHHNLFPGLKRSSAGPMPFSAVDLPQGNSPEEVAARPAFCIPQQAPLCAFQYPAGFTAGGIVAFTPPCSVVYESVVNPIQTELLAVPSGPGRALVFTAGVPTIEMKKIQPLDIVKGLFTNPKQVPLLLARMAFERSPTYKSHLRSNKLFDQDSVFLTLQDYELARRGKPLWAKEYYMPVSCDGAIIAARRWADAALQQPLSCETSATPAAQLISLTQATAAAAPRPAKQQINDRFNQHTKHCMICQKALKSLQQRLVAAKAAAAALAAGCVAVLAGVVLPKILAGVSAVAATPPAAIVGPAGGTAVAVAMLLGLGALLAAAVATAAAKEVDQFVYVEYSHADNH